jgi:hypothetical protein
MEVVVLESKLIMRAFIDICLYSQSSWSLKASQVQDLKIAGHFNEVNNITN